MTPGGAWGGLHGEGGIACHGGRSRARSHLAGVALVLLSLVGGGCGPTSDPQAPPSSGGEAPIVEPLGGCDAPGVQTVLVDARRGDPEDGTQLRLRYRVWEGPTEDAPTVVVVPGGPGTAILEASPEAPYALGAAPIDRARVIFVEARGSGCNVFPAFDDPEAVYALEAVARDLLAVLDQERVEAVTIYGASFGTAVASVAASLAAEAGHPQVDHLVLEGTLGRSFLSFEDYIAPLRSEWDRVEALLDPAWRTAFATEPWDPTLYWSRAQWGAFISAQLILGDVPGEGPILRYWLRGLSAEDPGAQAYVAGFMAGAAEPTAPSSLFQQIGCREIWGRWQSGREIRDGALAVFGEDRCAGIPFSSPFDVAAYPVRVPTTHLHGPHDPTTTRAQVTHHLRAQRDADRRVVTVPDASHAPLTLGLAGRGCAEAFWTSILEGTPDLQEVEEDCNRGGLPAVEVVEHPAGRGTPP